MTKVLFICHGSICRSPMCEYVMKDMVEKAGIAEQFEIASAATSREEIGNPVYPPARRKLAEHNISCKGHHARQMTRQDYDDYDYIVCMDRRNIRNASKICGGDPAGKITLLLDHTPRAGEEVADPWYTGNFDATWRDVTEGCEGLLKEIDAATPSGKALSSEDKAFSAGVKAFSPEEEDRAAEVYNRFKQRSSKDDEYHDWEEYRGQVTAFIVKNTRPGASLLILGAGKCNDMDLKVLREHCGSISLSDYRPETAEEAFRRYGITPSDELRFAQADFVGITDEDYLRYTKLLIRVMEKLRTRKGSSLEEMAGEELVALQEELARIYRCNEEYRVDLGSLMYDHAVIVGVHSQLNNSFRGIFQYVRKDVEEAGGKVRCLKELNEAVFQCTRVHTLDLVRRLNEAVFSIVREGVVYGYEDSIIFTPEGRRFPVIGTVDGARQAGEELEGLPVTNRAKCLWPLSRRRRIRYEVELCYIDLSKRQGRWVDYSNHK